MSDKKHSLFLDVLLSRVFFPLMDMVFACIPALIAYALISGFDQAIGAAVAAAVFLFELLTDRYGAFDPAPVVVAEPEEEE